MEDYEERYNKLVNFIKDLYPHTSDYVKEKLEGFIPELKESEDERIRKEIISFITDRENWFPKEETKTSWIAWIEKQGEANTEDFGEFINELSKKFPEVSFAKLSRIAVRVKKWLEKKTEQKPAWSEEDETMNQAKNDLFFADKEELTEFDYAVLSIISDHNSHTDSIEAFAKRSSKKLLDLARKEILKDLPKWKKANVFVSNEFGLATRDDDLIITQNGYQIKLSDLKTLPKEE